ncbi:hypothetical protein A5881_000842 [Enterococcus termitis]|nr:hypothetical protein A5881_001056 [Enterococcus termitis]
MNEDLLVPNKCKSCGGLLNDLNTKYCPNCGRMLDEIQTLIDKKNQNVETCPNCGSSIVFNIEKQCFECEHCASTFSTQKELDAIVQFYQADKVVPFQVEQERAKMRFYEWFSVDQESPVAIENITLKQVYIPFSVVTIRYECHWEAEVGYTTFQENSGENWSYSDGRISGECFSFFSVSEEMNIEADKLFSIASFKPLILKMVPYDDHYLTGKHQLKIAADEVMKTLNLFQTVTQYAAEDEMRKVVPGDRNRNARVTNLQYEPFSEFVYIPIWQLEYQINESIFEVLITATDKENINLVGSKPSASDFPEDELTKINKKYKKKYRWSIVAFLISLILIMTYDRNNEPGVLFSIITLSLFFGGFFSWLVFGIKSKLMKRAYLKSKKISQLGYRTIQTI